MKKILFAMFMALTFVIFALFAVASCSSDDSLTQEAPADEYVAKAKELLSVC